MPDLLPQERLQPSLLDRLRDDAPQRVSEPLGQWVLSTEQLRASVQRDLEWLFNCPNLEDVEDFSRFPLARRSVVNYGVPDLAGKVLSSTNVIELQRQIREAILTYEPRLMPDSLRITIVAHPDGMGANALQFRIEARLWANPIPVYVLMRTAVDLETAQATVTLEGGR